MSKNIYKTPNSIENQINKIKQKNSSMFNNIVIFANVLTRNNFIEKSKKYVEYDIVNKLVRYRKEKHLKS